MERLTATIVPLLGGLFLVLGVGALLRVRGHMGQREADTLNALIMDVTMPALLVHVLTHQDLEWRDEGKALLAATLALVAAGAAALAIARALGVDRKGQGAAALSSSFANTGFLGFPLILALYPASARASSTAIVVDTVDTTLLLWTAGLAFATRMGASASTDALRTSVRGLVKPLTVALVVGVGLRALDVHLPAFLDDTLASVGKCTSPLVFLALGLQLDVQALRGRALPVLASAAVKLLAAPLVCLALVRALHVEEPAASVAVLQCAMPSAMASVIVSARAGCDRALSAGIATLTTLACLLTLPASGALLDATR